MQYNFLKWVCSEIIKANANSAINFMSLSRNEDLFDFHIIWLDIMGCIISESIINYILLKFLNFHRECSLYTSWNCSCMNLASLEIISPHSGFFQYRLQILGCLIQVLCSKSGPSKYQQKALFWACTLSPEFQSNYPVLH